MDSKVQQKLIKDCKKNKRKAQNELFRNYSNLVMSICRRYGMNIENAEDAFQECFIQIFKSLVKSGNKVESLDSWIARITINTNISIYYKTRKVEQESLPEDLLDESYKHTLDAISNEELLAIINEIPDGYRVIFNMHFIDGYKHSEIAKQLDITESTSRSQLTRAKEYLRKKLELKGIYRYEAS